MRKSSFNSYYETVPINRHTIIKKCACLRICLSVYQVSSIIVFSSMTENKTNVVYDDMITACRHMLKLTGIKSAVTNGRGVCALRKLAYAIYSNFCTFKNDENGDENFIGKYLIHVILIYLHKTLIMATR